MKEIKDYQTYYFLGIGGIGMSAIARYFHRTGKKVLGYDKTSTKLTNSLEKEGIGIGFSDQINQEIQELSPEDTLVIYTPAIKESVLMDYFVSNGFAMYKRAKVLGLLTQQTNCIAVAGTHGKTTTSTLIAHLCKESGLDFSAFLGGVSQNFGSNFFFQGEEATVVEADEYDRSFLNLAPNWAVITSMDADHLDIYGDASHIEQGFCAFAALVEKDENLFVRKGLDVKRNAITYAVNEKADYYSDNIRMDEKGNILFDFHTPQGSFFDFSWSIPGIHNVENATAALAIVHGQGVGLDKLKNALALFEGIKRRYTKRTFASQKIYIDDYAHHPTEINAVLGSVKTFYPDKKILLVFQPHLFSRTRDFVDDFAKSLSAADELLLLDIYPAREKPMPGISSQWLLEKVQLPNGQVASLANAFEKIKEKEFDILITMGAGDIDTLYDPIVEWLEQQNGEKQ